MATRASVVIYDEWDETPLVEMYKHWDGYPDGFGADLEQFCEGYAIVNGIGSDTPKKAANGMGCFAAQLIDHFKEGIGDVSIIPVGKEWGQEYRYHVKPSGNRENGVFGGDPLTVKIEIEEV